MTPEQVTTLLWLAFVVVGLPIIGIAVVAWLEVKTLRDKHPGNHITATLQAAFRRQPGAFVVLGGVWGAFLLALLMGIAGHVFWGGE